MDTETLAARMIGESASFLQMQEHLSRLAPLNKPVLIIGERGTGKELVASRLHYLSQRWGYPFLKINCASFNEALLESQLFGHEAGAFTGASKQQKGYFERADQGTLFLDELATTSMAVQERILRITEYGELERLGGNKPIEVDVRLVAATNIDLPELAEQGKFRQDLLDRLAFDVITLPPLRERIEDIPVLAQHFAIQMIKELEREFFPGFSKTAAKELLDYSWPGNIRELKNVVERAIYQSEDPQEPIRTIVFDPFESPYRPVSQGKKSSMPRPGEKEFKQQVQDFEISLLQDALRQSQFNQRKTAKLLGLSYDQLRGYLRKYEKEIN
ncbi:MAG: phage shock protein operon transcriptional activator [Gammaproteobacteria bacterium]|nr:phage shock protein operon transcriptional activator [Gammaproteobacteria bacterium]MAY01567.1 phage shock protein operon transcriptional activator [Gammaproteobacteria bacterium]|tara:strand:+ start:526 stop:1515 length:990 start_codon:yes stop_codon:yes gene_type:complete